MQISDNRTRTPLVYLSVALLLAIAVLPFGWMLLSSLKTLQELYSIPTTWLPNAATLANYRKVLFDSNIPRYFVNSTIVSVGSTVLGVVFATPAAYAFSRLRFRGRNLWQTLVLISHLLPSAALVVPLYIFLGNMKLLNTLSGLTVVYLV